MTRAALLEEIQSTPRAVRRFDVASARPVAEAVLRKRRLLIVGEGSSRIFPAKRAIAAARRRGLAVEIATEGCRQAQEYSLQGWVVLALSRSGKTREVLALRERLRAAGHDALFTAGESEERALAATRSVILEALFVEAALDAAALAPRLEPLAAALERLLAEPVDQGLADALVNARHVYFAGRNDGVAEELVLKCVEIARKPSAFFEGTYLLHGVHAALRKGDAVVFVEPFGQDDDRVLALLDRAGVLGVAIASRPTPFPTLRLPSGPAAPVGEYLQLASGWNLLVAVGAALGVDLDGRDLRV